ncbi:MAG: metallophosphoesterase [Prochloraceae cyanobacterium]
MFNLKKDLYFAAVGDVHGDMYLMLNLLKKWEAKHCRSLSFILQVGDFEAHRHQKDLTTMDAPSKYKKLGDFQAFYRSKAKFPYPIYFIGGNHEPYGFLDLYPNGGEIARNCYYFGRVGSIELAGLKIVGLSGIYKPELFDRSTRPPIEDITIRSNSDYLTLPPLRFAKKVGFFLQRDLPRPIPPEAWTVCPTASTPRCCTTCAAATSLSVV